MGVPTPTIVNSKWEEMKNSLKEIKVKNEEKAFKFKEVYLYHFDRLITSVPLPRNFETPKFHKYWGKGDPVSHIKEFYMGCKEVVYNDI